MQWGEKKEVITKTETNDKRTEQSASIMFIPRTSGGELAGKMNK